MEEGRLIYVAGNPDAGPIERYSAETGTYEGVLPELLRRFAEQEGYELVYYDDGGEDMREHLAGNYQVDIVSGYTQDEKAPRSRESVTLFRTTYGGEETAYVVYLTKAAPAGLSAELERYFGSVTAEEVGGVLIETAPQPDGSAVSPLLAASLALAVFVLLCALGGVIRHYRRRLLTERKEYETDAVTGLCGVEYLRRSASKMLHDRNRVLYSMVVFTVDADRLHRFAGGQETDDALRYCALTLRELCSVTDILSRSSENAFALLKLSGSEERLGQWVEAAVELLRSYPETHGKPFDVRVSAGVCPLHREDRDLSEALFNAEQASQDALHSGEPWRMFTDETLKKLELEKRLRATINRAVSGREFQLFVQFYVDAHTGRIVGGEALSRWMHPEKGLLMPNVFVPLLEREGIVSLLDYACLRSACEFLQELASRGVRTFFLSCNFSRETFAAADFVEKCREIMDGFTFPRWLLIFELTESAPVSHLSQLTKNMAAMREYGVRIALDDFGEGFTSFFDLQQYPIDGIKLDKALVDNYATKNGRAILRGMIQVGHEFGVTILAEGIETQRQADALRELHCDVLQGFLYSKPLPAPEAQMKILAAGSPDEAHS